MLAECLEIVDKCLNETRTISYLLHPPLLDEAGFGSAAHWYVDGFAKRSGIKVNLELPFEPLRMHSDVEVALFRVLQEGLTNIYKHSKASVVDVRLMTNAEGVSLKIHDNGRGMPKPRREDVVTGKRASGVGIAGMRERIRELGGSLDLQSNGKGTTVSASIPVKSAYPENG
jgi:signal transduction histidine kinase